MDHVTQLPVFMWRSHIPQFKIAFSSEAEHHKCASQKKQNDTLKAVNMTTVLPLVLSQ